MKPDKDLEMEKFEKEIEQIKRNKEEYFKLVTTGHCAICLSKLDVTQEMIDTFTSMSCNVCQEAGLQDIFNKGLVCGLELQKWKEKHK